MINPERPNILFIWTDQQTASAMSNAGNPWLNTPAMDSLAQEGVVFENTYCSNPLCVPSRTSWICGRMPHETSITYNGGDRVTANPLSRQFREHGYDTGYVGKWHIPHDVKDHDWHGFDFMKTSGGDRFDPAVFPDCDQFLRQKRDKPFFLVASFINPHDICQWAREASGMEEIYPNGNPGPAPSPENCPPLPDNFEIPGNEPEVIRRLHTLAPSTYPTANWKPETWRQYLWAYYRMTEMADQEIGKILSTVRELGLDKNTLIIFTSDHGDGAAAHSWNQKTLFYEESAKVPFIVRPPACSNAGHRDRTNLVNMNLDFFPTVFNYAGIPMPNGLEGRSVRPLVEDVSNARGHEYIICQNDLAPVYGESGGVFGRMLRTHRYKYIRYSEGKNPEQLFDLQNDPGEMNNLSNDSDFATILQEHREILDSWMSRRGDDFKS